MKSVALIALGAGATIAFQKYRKPVMAKLEETTFRARKSLKKTLDNMM